jgi:hypothetical protein
MRTPSGPPPLLERWVEAWIGSDSSTPYVIGDLREEYVERRGCGAGPGAAAWYLLQGVRVAVRLRWGRRGRPSPGRAALSPDGLVTDLRQAVRVPSSTVASSLVISALNSGLL